MKIFASRGYHLARLSLPAKLVYTLFLVFIGLGLWTSWEIYATRIGGDLEGTPSVAARYLAAPEPAASRDSGGPALDLPPADGPALDLPAAEASGPVEDVKGPWILDVFHQHLFSVAVVYLILAHLFMLTRLATWLTSATVAVAGLSALAHVLAPVLIHELGRGLWLMPASGAVMGLTWTVMVLWTLAAMWLGERTGRDPHP